MKKKLLLFIAVLAIAACLFALAANASGVYADFTQAGANGEKPIFNCLGYAVDPIGGSLCAEYTVNLEALKAYEEKIGGKLNYGLVITNPSNVENGKPLDANGKPTGANKDKIHVISLNNDNRTSIVTVIVTGIDASAYKSEIVVNLFVQENSKVQYIADENKSTETSTSTSYDKVRGPLEVTVNDITYSIEGETEPAWDRIRQQNASNADYNTGSHYTEDELLGKKGWFGIRTGGIISKANLIITGGSVIGLSNAADFMRHYLDNTGTNYNLDVNKFISSDSGAKKSRDEAINNALRASEQLARFGEALTINQLTENHPMQNTLTDDWKYSLGSYFTDVDVINLTVTEVNGVKTYSADIKYIVTDFYNWDTNDYYEFKQIVSPHDLHELHKGGAAREFLTYGEITYKNITWTEGQTVADIAGLN